MNLFYSYIWQIKKQDGMITCFFIECLYILENRNNLNMRNMNFKNRRNNKKPRA